MSMRYTLVTYCQWLNTVPLAQVCWELKSYAPPGYEASVPQTNFPNRTTWYSFTAESFGVILTGRRGLLYTVTRNAHVTLWSHLQCLSPCTTSALFECGFQRVKILLCLLLMGLVSCCTKVLVFFSSSAFANSFRSDCKHTCITITPSVNTQRTGQTWQKSATACLCHCESIYQYSQGLMSHWHKQKSQNWWLHSKWSKKHSPQLYFLFSGC